MPHNIVYFSHGQESGPWGTKIQYLAEIARRQGFHVDSPDYSDIPDPEERVLKLVDLVRGDLVHGNVDKFVLVGSSAGGYVSAVASEALKKPNGLFLLAPAVFLRGFGTRNPQPQADHQWIVHGWNDEIVPAESVICFAKQHKIALHMLNGDHRLIDILPAVGALFNLFLRDVLGTTENMEIPSDTR
uniref:Alpha/beta hydrolase family protein n=1 Tax=Candidatus Kentrum sp. TUN TaxID=2126343 RepID=A0A450ZRB8_9GAMM|nr:MAG: Alpha/beta hydrolase family protein [Candidatus Kentron sp. TUN]VFK62373.1 MAG: Alpha/beta hydrolase family protein [Candidatus Kentron sp. TUN]